MKKFTVEIKSYLWLTSDQMNFVERVAPKYVVWDRSGAEDMVISEFKTLREARVFIRSFYAVMDAAKVDLMPRDKWGYIHIIRADVQK